jgi:hypothetical protein
MHNTFMRGIKKEHLPQKICAYCNRPFTWRKKWERGMERSKILQPHMQKEKLIHAGVDFGSKLAGTTVICYAAESGKINFLASAKKQDADEMLRDFFASSHISLICLDAPLSLPAAYKNPSCV